MPLEPVVDDGSYKAPPLTPKQKKKLEEQEEFYRQKGITSPEEMAKLFRQRGSTMFDSAEDQEMIASMLGKTPLDLVVPPSSSKAEIMGPLLQQEEETDEDFDELISKLNKELEWKDELTPGNPFRDLPASPKPASLQKIQSPTMNDAMPTPEISSEEANRLKSLLDKMSDKDIEAAFKSLSQLAAVKFQEKMSEEMKDINIPVPADKLPKIKAKNEAVRNQYEEEFKIIEEELEKMAQNPLGVWKELMKDAEKYVDDVENNK